MKVLLAGFAIIPPVMLLVAALCLFLAELCVHSFTAKRW